MTQQGVCVTHSLQRLANEAESSVLATCSHQPSSTHCPLACTSYAAQPRLSVPTLLPTPLPLTCTDVIVWYIWGSFTSSLTFFKAVSTKLTGSIGVQWDPPAAPAPATPAAASAAAPAPDAAAARACLAAAAALALLPARSNLSRQPCITSFRSKSMDVPLWTDTRGGEVWKCESGMGSCTLVGVRRCAGVGESERGLLINAACGMAACS